MRGRRSAGQDGTCGQPDGAARRGRHLGTVVDGFDVAAAGRSACTGDWESEGVDYDATRQVLRVAAIEPLPCLLNTVVFRFAR